MVPMPSLRVVRTASAGAQTNQIAVLPEERMGNFVDESSGTRPFISCTLIGVKDVDGKEYGVGCPVDTPVMITCFQGKQLLPVRADSPEYDDLVQHISGQLEDSDLQLCKTPVVLTLHGDLDGSEDEETSECGDACTHDHHVTHGGGNASEDTGEEVSLEDLLQDADFVADEAAEESELEQQSHSNFDATAEGSPASSDADGLNAFLEQPAHDGTTIHSGQTEQPGFTIHPSNTGGLTPSDIPEEALVTEEDERSLLRAHRKADRIMKYAADMKLLGSFHFRKKNFHLVRLLEVRNYYL
jgi:hypothetical protein